MTSNSSNVVASLLTFAAEHITGRAVSHVSLHCIAWQDAEVFRRARGASEPQGKTASAAAAGAKRTRGVAFGSGAADEDYAVDDSDKRKGLLFEIAEGSDEDDMPVVMGR